MTPAHSLPSRTELVAITVEGAVGRITLNAPERLNAVDADMLESISDGVSALGAHPDVRVITLTGTGRGFCSGAHLSAVSSLDDVGATTLDCVGRAIRTLIASRVPVLGLVNGVTAGVGFSLALATHYILATESASFLLGFNKIGLMPDGAATALVAASAGRSRALRLALTGEQISAATALDWGLIAQTCPDEQFGEVARGLEQAFANGAPLALAATTEAINAATLPALDQVLGREELGQRHLLTTDDFREGVTAFTERRAPQFRGE